MLPAFSVAPISAISAVLEEVRAVLNAVLVYISNCRRFAAGGIP